VAVVNLPHATPELTEEPLFDEDLLLVVPDDHLLAGRGRVSMTDLDGLALLLPAPFTAYRAEIDEAARDAAVTLRARVEVDGLRLIASLTSRGYGPAILPATGASEIDEGYARVAVDGLPRRRVGVVLRRRSRPSAPARAMLAILDEVVKENLDAERGIHAPRR
ncbi:MAG: LysR family transcriptional regulator substrate-binding protein, partial [Actinomycetota bacterium]|nr:LysR family transcriptional regulator substrate-binding protein [Actinomycetota bacterium]